MLHKHVRVSEAHYTIPHKQIYTYYIRCYSSKVENKINAAKTMHNMLESHNIVGNNYFNFSM